ncbi:MAG: GNAT family N-acetyltransferase [bacterium]|nr:GNAT family N-acetyltransferase [bacterium]
MNDKYYERKMNDVIRKCPIEAGVEILVYNVLDYIIPSRDDLALVDINRIRKDRDSRFTTESGIADMAVMSSDFEYRNEERGEVFGLIEVKAASVPLHETKQVLEHIAFTNHYVYTNGLVWKYYENKNRECKWEIHLFDIGCNTIKTPQEVSIDRNQFSNLIKRLQEIDWRQELNMLTPSDRLWNEVRDYAKNCSWSAGQSLADAMDKHLFTEWERVIVARKDHKICGYCTVAKTDCIPDVCYTPYIGYLFVGEAYRGNRLSQRMIRYAMDYLRSIGFDNAYIVSDHENLYEKYGFEIVDRKMAPWGSVEKIYMQRV